MERWHTSDMENSRFTWFLQGRVLLESGYPLLRDGEESYEIENKYGYSYEEIFSSGFYSARKELFFRMYKEVMLSKEITPGKRLYISEKKDYGGFSP